MTLENIIAKFDEITDFLVYYILPALLVLAVIMLVWVLIVDHRRKKAKQVKKKCKRKAHGVIFGKKLGKYYFSPTDAEGHIVVFGGSGLGKTQAVLCPTLQSWTNGGTSFVIDISGDISEKIDVPNKLVYEPERSDTTPYNVFGAIDAIQDKDDKNEALTSLAHLLMPDDEKMSDAGKYYNTEGRKILIASFIAFYHAGMDFIEICEKVVYNGWKELFNAIDATNNEDAIKFINSFAGTSETNTANSKQEVDSVLTLFATNKKVKNSIRRPRSYELAFTPDKLETHNVYVVIDDAIRDVYAPLLNLITAQSLHFLSGRENYKKPTILFCLDEFASLGKMDILNSLRKARKKGVRIMVLTQSLADLDLVYSQEERKAMMNNFKFKLVLGADDTDTQEYFAKLIGYKDTTKHSTSSNANQTTHTETEAKEWCVEPAELARLNNQLVLLHPDGYMLLKKNFIKRKKSK